MLLHKIKDLCHEKGISISELERQAGLAPRSIDKWISSMPSADKLLNVAKVLGTTSEELLKD